MSWTKITSGSSTPITQTTDSSGFFYERENLHDTTQEVSGYIDSNGVLQTSTTYTATAYIPVIGGNTYISSYAKTIASYDTNKTFLGNLNTTSSDTTSFNAPRPFNIPANVSYVRMTRGSANSIPMFMRGSTLPNVYLAPGTKQLLTTDNQYSTSLYRQLSPLYGLTWNCLGDSVTAGGYPDTGIGSSGGNVVPYHQVLAAQYGLNVNNYGIGGTTITNAKDGTANGFCQRYGNMSANADIITVFGGINDYSWSGNTPIGTFGVIDNTTMYGAMDTLCSGLLQMYPTKKLGFILPHGFNEYKGTGTWQPYEDAMTTVLEHYGIPYINLRKVSLLNANIDYINNTYFKQQDRTHPLSQGHAIIARKVFEFLKTL